MNKKFKCICCGQFTLEEEPKGTYQICPVCFWEDDPVQSKDPNFKGGANVVSLNEAKKNFLEFGASSKENIKNVRKPLKEEFK